MEKLPGDACSGDPVSAMDAVANPTAPEGRHDDGLGSRWSSPNMVLRMLKPARMLDRMSRTT